MKPPHLPPPSPEHERLCVLYDPATGRIVHTHRVMTMPGGRRVDEEEMERRTRERARSRGRDIKGLALLHIDPKTHRQDAFYKVDVEAKTLVETTFKPPLGTRESR
jgi:hypothetical protein